MKTVTNNNGVRIVTRTHKSKRGHPYKRRTKFYLTAAGDWERRS